LAAGRTVTLALRNGLLGGGKRRAGKLGGKALSLAFQHDIAVVIAQIVNKIVNLRCPD
jgi:hypothetical protein